jgi:hypothetical protein
LRKKVFQIDRHNSDISLIVTVAGVDDARQSLPDILIFVAKMLVARVLNNCKVARLPSAVVIRRQDNRMRVIVGV